MAQKKRLLFYTGCAINKDMFYLASTPDNEDDDDTSVSRMLIYQDQMPDKWLSHDLTGWRVTSVCSPELSSNSTRKFYALSEQGDIECYSQGKSVTEKITDAGLEATSPGYGYVNCIRQIGSHLYVCGHGGQVYRRETSGWVHIDADILQKPVDLSNLDERDLIATLTSDIMETILPSDINGLDEKSVYTVGMDGYIAFFNGEKWTVAKKTTSSHLNFILPVSSDVIWIAGNKGTLLKGNINTGFTAVTCKSVDTDFYSLAIFKNRLFIGADDGIYELDKNTPNKLPVSDDYGLDGVRIEVKDGVLWALSYNKLARFNGEKWDFFEPPHDI